MLSKLAVWCNRTIKDYVNHQVDLVWACWYRSLYLAGKQRRKTGGAEREEETRRERI